MTPAMRSVIWEIGAALDEARVQPGAPETVTLQIPTRRLRGEDARDDNAHLKVTLGKLMGFYLTGEHKGEDWGAVLIAEWSLEQGGSIARILIPPKAVAAILTPKTFAKIEARAAHSLTGHGRQLYVLLADRKNMRQSHWTYTVPELRALMGCEDKKTYQVWAQFNKWVLQPALKQVNDFGTVSVKMSTKRLARSVQWVRFDWRWKDPHEAEETAVENERHSKARRKQQGHQDAPPMLEEVQDAAQIWWRTLGSDQRKKWAETVGETVEMDGPGGKKLTLPRKEHDIVRAAHTQHLKQSN